MAWRVVGSGGGGLGLLLALACALAPSLAGSSGAGVRGAPPAPSLSLSSREGRPWARRDWRVGGGAGGLRLRGGEGEGQHFFAFEGLIGAGKSTLLARLEEKGIAVIPEPLKAWQDSGIFGAFYGDMTRWGYTFQTSAFVTRVQAVEDALRGSPATKHFIGERSWFADAYVFERLLHRDGHISEIEHAAYQQWWTWLNHKAPATRGIIYLRARPETCLSRIKKRQRSEEAGIPLEYLEGLYAQHERWLIDKETPYGHEDRKVLVLDANPEFESDSARVEAMIERILAFIRECTEEQTQTEALDAAIKKHAKALQRSLSGTTLPPGTLYWDGPRQT